MRLRWHLFIAQFRLHLHGFNVYKFAFEFTFFSLAPTWPKQQNGILVVLNTIALLDSFIAILLLSRVIITKYNPNMFFFQQQI